MHPVNINIHVPSESDIILGLPIILNVLMFFGSFLVNNVDRQRDLL